VGYTEEAKGKKGRIFSVNFSGKKGVSKEAVGKGMLIEGFGLEGDAHSGPGLRQVSLLAAESIKKQAGCPTAKKKDAAVGPGDFAENITTEGLNIAQLNIGTKVKIGREAIIEISKIGKECHKYCAIYEKAGGCIMPREGVFAKVIKGGEITVGDEMEVLGDGK